MVCLGCWVVCFAFKLTSSVLDWSEQRSFFLLCPLWKNTSTFRNCCMSINMRFVVCTTNAGFIDKLPWMFLHNEIMFSKKHLHSGFTEQTSNDSTLQLAYFWRSFCAQDFYFRIFKQRDWKHLDTGVFRFSFIKKICRYICWKRKVISEFHCQKRYSGRLPCLSN